MANALSARQVSVAFDGLKALSNVTLSVPRGEVTGLIGPNGAGKTTFVNVLTGFQQPDAGEVLLDGEDVGHLKPHLMRRRGIARTFQSGRLFADLSVLDNLEVTGVGLGLTRREAAGKPKRCWSGSASEPWRSAPPARCPIPMNAALPLAGR